MILFCVTFFRNIEKKYQEQIKSLQSEVERERELMNHQAAKQRRQHEGEVEAQKEEESKLRERLMYAQKVCSHSPLRMYERGGVKATRATHVRTKGT